MTQWDRNALNWTWQAALAGALSWGVVSISQGCSVHSPSPGEGTGSGSSALSGSGSGAFGSPCTTNDDCEVDVVCRPTVSGGSTCRYPGCGSVDVGDDCT